MNERLTLQDLVDILAKKQDITKKDAELFLRELIGVITENIEKNESVKIKDFGTFRLVKVSSRRSVDVNTGEAIEIAAHYKLNFAPDKSLRESINRPFAHFESIILEDGVSFEHVKNESFATEDVSTEEDTDEITDNSDPNKSTSKQPVDQITTVKTDSDSHQEKSNEIYISDSLSDKQEPVTDKEDNAVIESETKEPVLLEDNNEPESSIKYKEATNVHIDISEEEIDKKYDKFRKTSLRKKRYTYLFFFIAILLFSFIVGALFFNEISKFFSEEKPTESTIIQEGIEVLDNEDVFLTDTLAINSAKDSIATESANVESQTNDQANTTISNTETLGEEIIKEGQTLRLIALKYYGNKAFWVYIYQDNKSKIKNPNNVAIGTKLTVPSLEKYNVDPKSTQEIQKALRMEQQIISQVN